jgi:hypothetical protein
MALPSSVFGPVDSFAFCWLAATWAGVDIIFYPTNTGQRSRSAKFDG